MEEVQRERVDANTPVSLIDIDKQFVKDAEAVTYAISDSVRRVLLRILCWEDKNGGKSARRGEMTGTIQSKGTHLYVHYPDDAQCKDSLLLAVRAP